MKFTTSVLVLVLLSFCVACSSAKDDMENVCNATDRAGTKNIADPGERAHQTALWLEKNIKTKEVKKDLASLSYVGNPQAKAESVRMMAVESGYEGPCPEAELLAATPR